MKKTFTAFLILTLTLSFLSLGISANRTLGLVVDDAALLTQSEKDELSDVLEAIVEAYNVEIAVVTVNSTGAKSTMQYADDFYDYNGYGWGTNDDGALLLVDMGTRQWWITTHGTCVDYLDYYTLGVIEDEFISYLANGDYAAAFTCFAVRCAEQIEYIQNGGTVQDGTVTDDGYEDDYYYGTDFDDDYYYDDKPDSITNGIGSRAVISLVAGFGAALVIVGGMAGKMKTVKSAISASNYVIDNSLSLRQSSDRYLYRNVVRTRRDTSSHSSGGRSSGGFSGGSHRSSSGRSHGGRGGRF